MNIEDKIKALSQKTLENGASQAEVDSAQRMIARLRFPVSSQKNEDIQKYADGAYNNFNITDVDWDTVAEQYLNRFQHADYVNETHTSWERYNKTRLNLAVAQPMSLSEYRRKCNEVFTKLYDRKQIS